MRRHKLFSSVLLLLVVVTLVASCGPAPTAEVVEETAVVTEEPGEAPTEAEETEEEEVTEEPTESGDGVQRGGSLTWAEEVIPQKVDPLWTQARADNFVLRSIVETLTRVSEDGDEILPALAESWETSEDGLTYTFHLREGVQFHNGEVLSAEDVTASLERVQSMGVWKWTVAEIDEMEAVDDLTVEINLSQPVPGLDSRLAIMANAIFPAEEIERIGEEEFVEPIGTGPFKFVEWVRGDHLTIAKNDNYWMKADDGEAYPYLDEITFTEVKEATTRVLQVQAGSIDGTTGLPFPQIDDLRGDPQGKLVLSPVMQIYFMVVQCSVEPFDDIKVRQAMSYALDREVFVERSTAGVAEPANSLFAKSERCWNPDAELPYDLEKAKELMAESEYPEGYSGLTIEVPAGNQMGRDNAVLAQQMWGEIGLEFDIQEVESSTLGDRWYNSDFEVISGYQWTQGTPDLDYHVQFFIVDPRMNAGWEGNERATELAEAVTTELDPEKRCEMYKEIQEIYNEEQGGTISLFYTPNRAYVGPHVNEWKMTPVSEPLFYKTWVEQ